jgi:cyclophilin family peptidyl-prolyl cis-trans isomerase
VWVIRMLERPSRRLLGCAKLPGLVLLLLLGIARGQDEEDKPQAGPRPTVKVPAGTVPVIDGTVSEEEWKDGTSFEVRMGEDILVRGRIKRAARQLFLACESELSPWALGLRFNFADPASRRSTPVLVTPLFPPLPPITVLRRVPDRQPESLPCASCDVRFSFPAAGGVAMELRIPMDLVEFSRSGDVYSFGVEVRDLQARRTLGLFPPALAALGSSETMARLESTDTWGADAEPKDIAEHPALKLIEDLNTVVGAVNESSGWHDGRRKDAPLAVLQQRLERVISAYPDYVSLRAANVQVNVARGDLAGALAVLDRIETAFPPLATTPQHLLVRTELLRNLERPDEALALLGANAEQLEGDRFVARERVVLANLRDCLRAEQEIRRREAQEDDLPRVRVKTSKGEFVLELFEDDAPNAVANFISLSERGFYDGTRFFWCEGGRRVLGGDPNTRDDDPHNDGFGDPGYLIESNPSRRLNLAYMVAFADKRRARHTEGCTFVIHMAPFPELDGANTVFGRVIEGHATIGKLEYYDVIEGTKVVRKRDHPYEPVKRP